MNSNTPTQGTNGHLSTEVEEIHAGKQRGPGRFVQVPHEIIEYESVSRQARFTWIAARKYKWGDGRCFPSEETLASDMGCSVRTVRRDLAELAEAGLLRIKRWGHGKGNEYIFPDHPEPSRSESKRKPASNGHRTNMAGEYRTNMAAYKDTEDEYLLPSGGNARGESNPEVTAKDQTTALIRAIRDSGGYVTSDQSNGFGKEYKQLLDNEKVTSEELERIIAHIARQWSRIALSVNQAFGDVRSGRDRKHGASSARADSSATPTAAIEAIEAREDLAQFAQLAREFDFRSELWPEYKILQKLGSDNMERQDTLRKLHRVSCGAAGGLRDAGENAATPKVGIEAIRADERFSRFVGVAHEHNFASDAEPSIRTLCNLGANDPAESRRTFDSIKSVARRAVADEAEGPLTSEERDTLREKFESMVEDPPNEFLMYWDGGTSMLATKLAASILGRSTTQTLDDAAREILDGMKEEIAA